MLKLREKLLLTQVGSWGFLPSTLVFQFDKENIQNSETERPIGWAMTLYIQLQLSKPESREEVELGVNY